MESEKLLEDGKNSNRGKKKSVERDTISSAMMDLESALIEVDFPEVPQDPLEDFKDESTSYFEIENEQKHMFTQLDSSEDLQSCEEITEVVTTDECVDACVSFEDIDTTSIEKKPDVYSPSAPFGGEELSQLNYPSQDMYSDQSNKMRYPDLIAQISSNINQYRNNAEKLTPFTEAEMATHYYNQELHNYDFFVDNFIEVELKSGSVVRQPLHQLLMEYLTCRDNLCKNKLEFDGLIAEYKQNQEKIWNSHTSSYTEHGECQDGNGVSATHHYKVSHFNDYIFENFTRNVNQLEILTNELYITNVFNIQLLRTKIQHYVHSLCYHFSFLSPQAPIELYNESAPRGPLGADFKLFINELRNSISVLFSFQRRPMKDEEFILETRQWLEKLISVLLRVSTANDHLFIIHHVMRCPAGVSKWASHFIQPPIPNNGTLYSQQYVDHLITNLAILLLPVTDRSLFLQQMEVGLEENGMWVIIDSDGEDSDDNSAPKTALKENDLVAFLNQIPFAELFRQIILVGRRDDEDVYDINVVTDRDILRSIAISTLLVNLLDKGIENYSSVAYKQFCKRLSLLVKHTASYVTDQWQLFREAYTQRSVVDSAMLNRLQTEYDEFLFRVVNNLYATRDRIGWQYLATLPFDMITSHSLWRMYQYLLHTNNENDILMSEEFMENMAQLPDNDIYYFLTTITNMALIRSKQDWVFIQTVTLQLFQVGFINVSIRDKCMKSSRILIANLTSKYPELISDLIVSLRKDFVLVGKFSLYLFRELPIAFWKPNHVDTLALSDWLLNCNLTSSENNLARFIISQLNWSTDYNDMDLFLPREFHCQIAILIVKTLYAYAEETPAAGSTALISHGVRQVSSVVRGQTPEQILNIWAWQILSRLKLHLMDQPMRVTRMVLTDTRLIAQIPDINSDLEDMRIISNGIARNQSVAFYVALLTSNLGHDLPLICEKCWDYCCVLLSTYKYTQVLQILQHTLPYFLESIDSLLKLEKFQSVIVQLINADQTYMKMAKNLIISDFPRPILAQFAALIQYHVENYSRYCLPNPNQMVELWMRILSSIWSDNCPAVAYLMDKISSTVFTNDHLKQMVINILSKLVETLSSANRYNVSGGLSSLVSWIGYGNGGDVHSIPASLLPRSSTTVTHSPYFAYFALHLEEELFVSQTSLWTEVLKNLASVNGKANVDAALKKACVTNKFNPVGSNCLPIYRWAQYGMEIAHDHPILPLYWQRFFRLYLQRIHVSNFNGCIGSKFFEGTVNGVYFKKIKKKLQDCSDHFATKPVADEFEKNKYDGLNSLYKAFLLWLEEPRLQESDVYLPAFSAVFNTPKLSEIMFGELNIWLDCCDFDKMKIEQTELIGKWTKALYRNVNPMSNRIYGFPENVDVFKRIVERLQSYDKRVSPPELFLLRSPVPEIPRESLLNKTVMLSHLVEHFHFIVEYTKSYEIQKNEQIETARTLLDAFKHLFTEIDVNVELQAACDTASPLYKRKTISTIHCAGPATLVFQVRESRLNKTAKHTIDRCDLDFQRLLKNNVKNPPFQLTIACIVIELAAESLQKERAELNVIGDAAMLNSVQDVGVALFYKLASLYESEISEYFPTKLFARRTIERLGQSFIDGIETECPKLLTTLMNNSKLSVVLVPHFTPTVVSATTFVLLYRKVTTKIMTKNVDFILDVLTKFNVKDWLRKKSPKFADRSQLLEILSQALKDIGSQPAESLLYIHKILKRDLCEILVHEFPEHYGEILHVLLKYSAEEKFSADVWFDVLNSLIICTSGGSNLFIDSDVVPLRPGLSMAQIRDIARKYASELRSLTFQELVETANVLGSNFLKERQQYGLYGLYPKYTKYIEPIIALHSMIGHAAITGALHVQRGTLADKICDKILPYLMNMFSPWIVPYFTGNLQEPLAPWIQQLSDDRSVLLPWVVNDVSVANKMMATFTDCLKFISEALPASNAILSYICKWYILQYAHQSVKEHVLHIVQNNLITLNWSRFIPTVEDLEWMLKVIDQYLPVCHSFLGSIFIEIPWNLVVQNESPQITARIHVILLHLLIKLANEPNLRQSGKVSVLLLEARQYYWHLVDAPNYEHVLDWFVMSYDSRVILLLTDEDWNGIDMAAFDLLQVAAGYVSDTNNFHPTTLRKRQLFVKACVRMALQLANRYKAVLAVHHSNMESALIRMLDKMESVVNLTVVAENRASECATLLSELLVLINQPTGSVLPELMIQVLLSWLNNRSASSPVLRGLLCTIGTSVGDHFHLGVIMETCLNSWFKNLDDTEGYDWDNVLNIMQTVTTTHTAIEDCLVTNNQILSLYALTLKQIKNEGNTFMYSKLIQWITCLKPSTDNESKLPLLWSLVFNESFQNLQEILPSLLKLCNYFQQIINMKPGWALFGVIGMNKQHVPSLRCKILCYALNAFILMKLSVENTKTSDEKVEEASSLTDNESDKSIALVSAECIKAVSNLDSLSNDKHYAEYRITIDSAVRLIKSTEVTLSQGEQFISTLAKQLYTEGYIHAFRSDTLSNF